MPIAVLTFQFDPSAQLFGDLVVRWGTIALVGAIVAALVLAGVLARGGGLRPDDVVFVAIGIVPGAVIGGRLGYLILHADAFGATPGVLLDPSIGGLELGLAVSAGSSPGATSRACSARRSVAGCMSRWHRPCSCSASASSRWS